MGRRKVGSREALRDAAAELFTRKGYRSTTMDEVADLVGIAKPTVYQYVRSKGALLESISESLLERLRADLDRVTAIGDPGDQLRETVRCFVNAIHDLRPYFEIFFGEERELPPRTRKRFRKWAREITEEITAILERALKAGLLDPGVDPRIAAFLLIGMLNSIARWYEPKGRFSAEEIVEQVLRIVRRDPASSRRG